MTDWHPAYTLVAGVPIALLTSWITVKLALRRFQSEKWFVRKVDAYTNVIESLHHMKTTTNWRLHALERGVDISDGTEKKLHEKYRTSLAELRRLTDMGALVFSADAINTLDAFNQELQAANPEEGWWLYYDAQSAAIENCLKKIRAIAKRDLNA